MQSLTDPPDAPAASAVAPARALAPALALAALGYCFAPAVAAYASDHHYQSHFLFLWAFFAAALWRIRRRLLGLGVARGARGAAGAALAAASIAALHAGLVSGSSTAQRLALVLTFTALLLLLARGLGAWRCLGFGAFALLCFGVPYSAYSALTRLFRRSFVGLLAWVAEVSPLDYRVEGLTLHFADYALAITADCSGFNQLITFCGLAFVAALTARPAPRRTAALFALAVLLAYLANALRLLAFVVAVACGQRQLVDDQGLHAAVGFAAYAPFIAAFVFAVLRTHRPLAEPLAAPAAAPRRAAPWPVAALLLGLLAVRVADLRDEVPPAPAEPGFLAGLGAPPGYRLVARAPSEARERAVYGTPWLLNASFQDAQGRAVELFAYLTRSRRHLAVHQIADCLDAPGARVEYGPPIDVGGRRFWSLEMVGGPRPQHGYFAFWVDGDDLDDQVATQLEVFRRRLLGSGVAEVGLTRILLPGPLRFPVPAQDAALLRWRAAQLERLGGGRAAAPGR